MHSILELLKNYETGPFLFLNEGFRSSFMDSLMWWASNRFIWIPLYVFFTWMVYQKYPKNFWMFVIACALLILLNDQTCNLFKLGFERLRPTRDPDIGAFVDTVKGYTGGKYGFYSAHAACSFAVAMFAVTLRDDIYKLMIPIAFGYAVIVSYSRIYLGVHYPSDIVTGVIVGTFTGWLFAEWYKRLYNYMLNKKKPAI